MNQAFALHKSATVDMLLAPIQKYLDDSNVDELTINKPQELWVKNFQGWIRHEIPELTLQHIQSIHLSNYKPDKTSQQNWVAMVQYLITQ